MSSSRQKLLGAAAIGGFLCVAVVLLWSDLAGALFDDVIDIVVRTGRSVERRYDIDVIDRSDIPGESDQIGHALFWGAGMMLAGYVLRNRMSIAVTALIVGITSLGFEIAQPLLSQTRRVEPSDAVANLTGVALAALALAIALGAQRLVASQRTL